jgi:hypothetical protein
MGESSADTRRTLQHAIFSTFQMNPTPQAIKPLLEVATNYDMFRDQPIVPFYMEGLGGYGYKRDTGEVAKLLGRATGISPLKIDHVINGYLAGIGEWASAGVDTGILLATTGKPWNVTPQGGNRFYRPESAAGRIQAFYRVRNESSDVNQIINKLKEEDPKAAREFRKENMSVIRLSGWVKQKAKMIKTMNTQRRKIELSTRLSPSEKRAKIDAITTRINRALKDVNTYRRMAEL